MRLVGAELTGEALVEAMLRVRPSVRHGPTERPKSRGSDRHQECSGGFAPFGDITQPTLDELTPRQQASVVHATSLVLRCPGLADHLI